MAGAHLLDLGVQALAHLQAARNEDNTAIEEDGHRGCDGRRSAIKPARGRQSAAVACGYSVDLGHL